MIFVSSDKLNIYDFILKFCTVPYTTVPEIYNTQNDSNQWQTRQLEGVSQNLMKDRKQYLFQSTGSVVPEVTL